MNDRVFKIKIDEGVVHVATTSVQQAERQAKALSRDLKKRIKVVRCNTLISKGVYALGSKAKQRLGVPMWSGLG